MSGERTPTKRRARWRVQLMYITCKMLLLLISMIEVLYDMLFFHCQNVANHDCDRDLCFIF